METIPGVETLCGLAQMPRLKSAWRGGTQSKRIEPGPAAFQSVHCKSVALNGCPIKMALKSITSLKSLLSEVGTPDRLKLIERLGFGGQAEVWLARDQMLERFVTVKKVRAPSKLRRR